MNINLLLSAGNGFEKTWKFANAWFYIVLAISAVIFVTVVVIIIVSFCKNKPFKTMSTIRSLNNAETLKNLVEQNEDKPAQEKQEFCPYCDGAIEKGSVQCPSCGARLKKHK